MIDTTQLLEALFSSALQPVVEHQYDPNSNAQVTQCWPSPMRQFIDDLTHKLKQDQDVVTELTNEIRRQVPAIARDIVKSLSDEVYVWEEVKNSYPPRKDRKLNPAFSGVIAAALEKAVKDSPSMLLPHISQKTLEGMNVQFEVKITPKEGT